MGSYLTGREESNMMQLFFSSLQHLTFFLSLFIFSLVPGLEAKEGGTTIGSTAEYCALNTTHTMCMYTGASASCSSKTLFRGLSEASKSAFLDKHNELRSKVANGLQAGQPAAANMMKLKWNTELEAIAQRLADQCIFKHDKVRLKLDGTVSGQNVYITGSSPQQDQTTVEAKAVTAVQNWYDEVTKPGFNPANIESYVFDKGTGHYTQVVWAATTELGCGSVYFLENNEYKNLVVCNYAVSGNFWYQPVYISGTACSSCPKGSTCSNGLCVA